MSRFHIFVLIIALLLSSCAGIPEKPGVVSDNDTSTGAGEQVQHDTAGSADSAADLSGIASKSFNKEADAPGEAFDTAAASESELINEMDGPAPPETEIEFLERITPLIPEDLTVILDSNAPMGIMHDLDKNGFEDFLLLVVQSRDSGGAGEASGFMEAGDLRDTGRLFYEKREYFAYSVLIFYQYPEGITLRYTVPLSRQLVFDRYEIVEIKSGSDFPFGVSVSFKTRGGTREEWVILNGRGISGFVIEETLSVIPVVDDIDDDGFVDVVVHEQAAEEGMGYETFLTWYKWNGTDFSEEKSTNIVRNLRQFFSSMAELLVSGDHELLLDSLLFPETLKEFENAVLSDQEIMDRLFAPAEEQEMPVSLLEITDVVYPVLLETPFTYGRRGKFEFPVTLGIITPDGGYYYSTRIVMNRNPFSEKQFGLLPVE